MLCDYVVIFHFILPSYTSPVNLWFKLAQIAQNLFEILYERSYLSDIVNIQKIPSVEHSEITQITSHL